MAAGFHISLNFFHVASNVRRVGQVDYMDTMDQPVPILPIPNNGKFSSSQQNWNSQYVDWQNATLHFSQRANDFCQLVAFLLT